MQFCSRGALIGAAALLCTACGDAKPVAETGTWKLFPLPRSSPHDGLAVVNQPDGYGLHIFLETDTSDPAVCRPLWLPDPARLFNGNGTAPFSSGLASRQEFFEAVAREDVLELLQQELEQLCASRAPQATWTWVEPPATADAVQPVELPAYEEHDLLTNPNEELKRQRALLGDDTDTDGKPY